MDDSNFTRFPEDKTASLVLSVGVLMLLTLLCYGNALSGPFVLDDVKHIVDNTAVHRFDVKALWRRYPLRIVTRFSLACNYRLGGLRVWGYHLFNIAVHMSNSLLVLVLVWLLLRTPTMLPQYRPGFSYSPGIPLAAASIFCSHPIQTQAVNYVIQRAALLATFFYLATMVLYLLMRINDNPGQKWLYGGLGMACGILGMFTKEIVATLPLALLLLEICFFNFSWRRLRQKFLSALALLLPWLSLLALFCFSRNGRNIADNIQQRLSGQAGLLSCTDYFLTQLNVIRTYLRLLLVPISQNFDYDYPITRTLLAPETLCSLLLITICVATGLWYYRRNRLVSFAICFFFLALAVESSFLPIRDVIFEHRLYLPAIGFAIVAALLLFWLGHWRALLPRLASLTKFVGAMAAVIIILAIASHRRNVVWQQALTLWQDTVAKSPNKGRPYSELGAAYEQHGNYRQAFHAYQQALRLGPATHQTYNNLGNIYQHWQDYKRARWCYQQALQLHPNYSRAQLNLAIVYKKLKKVPEALRAYQQALQLDENFYLTHYNLALLYEEMQNYPRALAAYARARQLRPDFIEAYQNAGNVYYKLNDYRHAEKYYRQALALDSRYAPAYYNLGIIYYLQHKPQKAMEAWQATLNADPNHHGAKARLREKNSR